MPFETPPAPAGDDALRDLLKAAGLWTWDADLVDDTTVYQEGFWEAYGYTDQPTETFDMVQAMHRGDRAAVARAYRAHLDGETDIYESEWRLRTTDGQWRWIRSRGKVTERDARGEAIRMAGVYMDITQGRQAERLLAQAEAEMNAVYLGTQDGILVIDSGYRIRRINGAARVILEDLYERPVDEGDDIREYPALSYDQAVHGDIERIMAGESFTVERELRYHGGLRHFEISFAPIRQPNGVILGAALAFRDISERKRLEAARLQAMRLESMGLLAGGIAHDFNNLLTAIVGNIELAALHTDDPDAALSLDEARQAARRATELVQQLLAFAGQREPTIQRVDLSELVRELLRYARKMPGAETLFEAQLASDAPPIDGDATQLRQVVLNLLVNAVDATRECGGQVRVKTGTVRDIRAIVPEPVIIEREAEQYVFLRIADDGCGMDEGTRARIFDPFFTTKPAGHGLGLASVLSALRAHGGTIGVESRPGGGATFTLIIPAATTV